MRSARQHRDRRTAVGAVTAVDPPEPGSRAILLASEGRSIPPEVVVRAAELAKRSGGAVHVLVIARIWGTSLGFPNPGLNPSRREWDQARKITEGTVEALERDGVRARGRVVGTRAGAKLVLREAQRLGCGAIVMGADPVRPRVVADFMWSQEPQRVVRRARRTDVPVHLVPAP